MHCDGKCQLEDKLEKTQNQDPQKPINNNHQIIEIVLFINELTAVDFPALEMQNKNFFRPQSAKTKDRPHPVFRPPVV